MKRITTYGTYDLLHYGHIKLFKRTKAIDILILSSRRKDGLRKTNIHEYHIDTFIMGDDWKGKFDFSQEEGVEAVYICKDLLKSAVIRFKEIFMILMQSTERAKLAAMI